MLPSENAALFETSKPYGTDGRLSERHLQCVWYDDKLRPDPLTTTEGESIEVISPGRWNPEAGPDFLDAALSVGTERRRIEGDVEIHIRPSAWTRHGHAHDPRYDHVALHVTYFPGPHPVDLPRSVFSIALRDRLLEKPRFSFDDIDLAAYPHASLPQTPRPCQAVWGEDPDKGIAILQAAGRFRFERKIERMQALIQRTGDPGQALYEGIMAALGYKRNAHAFRLLARGYPLAEWSPGDPFGNYAILLGMAGLLPQDDDGRFDGKVLSMLWRHWWRNARPMPDGPPEWHLDSTRPANHPRRRLAAAASLFSSTAEWLPHVAEMDPHLPSLAKSLGRRLQERSTWPGIGTFLDGGSSSPLTAGPLIGDQRAAVIINNAMMPFLAAIHPERDVEIADNLRPETISGRMKIMANRLFGRDHNPTALYAGSGLRQQGLLQIYTDFCLNSRAGCKDCPLGKTASPPSVSNEENPIL